MKAIKINNKQDWNTLISNYTNIQNIRISLMNSDKNIKINDFKPSEFPLICVTTGHIDDHILGYTEFLIIYTDDINTINLRL